MLNIIRKSHYRKYFTNLKEITIGEQIYTWNAHQINAFQLFPSKINGFYATLGPG